MKNTALSASSAAIARQFLAVVAMVFSILAGVAAPAMASDLPTVRLSDLPQNLQDIYGQNRPELGKYGHCAAGFDSRTDGLKMAISCAIYVRLSAQGERKSVELCTERTKLLKIKAPCKLIVE